MRYVVATLTDEPDAVYQFDCGREDVENRLKELHHGLEMDRTRSAEPATEVQAG
jgi:hypothetical protein